MKVARKLTLLFLIGVLAAVSVYGYVNVKTERAELIAAIGEDLRIVGRAWSEALPHFVRLAGAAEAERLLDEAQVSGPIRIRWVRASSPEGDAYRAAVASDRLTGIPRGESLQLVLGQDTDDARLTIYTPFLAGSTDDLVEVSQSLQTVRHPLQAAVTRTAVLSLSIVLFGALFVQLLGVRLIGQPVGVLVEHARRVGAGDLSGRTVLRGRDEFAELGNEMNAMSDHLVDARQRLQEEAAARIGVLEQLRHADRLKTVGQLASGLAHELGTPLNVIAGHAKMIALGDVAEQEARDSAKVIAEQGQRLTSIVRQLLDFARPAKLSVAIGDLREVVSKTLTALGPLAREHHVMLTLDQAADPVWVRMDAGQIEQALTNVVLNGIQAMPKGGQLRVDLRRERVRPPMSATSEGSQELECARVTVADDGAGMPREQLERVFEPFFTTKGVGKGTGLGLSVTHGIVQEHGGWIVAESEVGRGSRFSIFLRIENPSAA